MENWKEGIDTQYSDSIKDVESVGDLVKNYHELKSTPKGLTIPDDNGDWDSFYNQLGRPENKQYLEVSDKERESLAAYEEIMYNSGLSKRQGQKLLHALMEAGDKANKEAEAANQKFKEDHAKNLKEKYGDNLESTMNLANAALSKYGTDNDIKTLIESGQYPTGLLDLLVNVGKSLTPDKLVTGQSQNTLGTKEAAVREIEKLQADDKFMQKYNDSSHPDHQSAIKTMSSLYEKAYASQ